MYKKSTSSLNSLNLIPHIHALSLLSGSSPPPAKEPVTAVTTNSATTTTAAQLQNTDAFAAVAQLFQSSQGQQVRVCAPVQTALIFFILVHLSLLPHLSDFH